MNHYSDVWLGAKLVVGHIAEAFNVESVCPEPERET